MKKGLVMQVVQYALIMMLFSVSQIIAAQFQGHRWSAYQKLPEQQVAQIQVDPHVQVYHLLSAQPDLAVAHVHEYLDADIDLAWVHEETGDTFLHALAKRAHPLPLDVSRIVLTDILASVVPGRSLFGRLFGKEKPMLEDAGVRDLLHRKNRQGSTPLHSAVQAGNKEMIELLLDCGVDAHAVNLNQQTPLHLAMSLEVSTAKKIEILYLLQQAQARVDLQDAQGNTPLAIAVKMSGNDPIFLRTVCQMPGIERAVNLPDKEGYRPMHQMVRTGKKPVGSAVVFFQHSAKTTGVHEVTGNTALHDAILRDATQDTISELVTLLVADLRSKGCYGLIFAALTLKNNDNLTVLQLAARGGYERVLYKLCHDALDDIVGFLDESYGAEKVQEKLEKLRVYRTKAFDEPDANGKRLLDYAVRANMNDVVKQLLSYSVKVDIQDADGCVPLHYAAQQGNPVIISALLLVAPRALHCASKIGQWPYEMVPKNATTTQQCLELLSPECAVCYETIAPNDRHWTKCEHLYCSECIKKHMAKFAANEDARLKKHPKSKRRKPTCPLCRSVL